MEVRVGGGVVCSGGASARDPALAALTGGNLFGRVAMHPALTEVGGKAELWEGAQSGVATVRGGELVGAGDACGWLAAGAAERARSRRLSPRDRHVVLAEDVAMGAVAVTGLASAAGGVRFLARGTGWRGDDDIGSSSRAGVAGTIIDDTPRHG